jgi:putative transposase
MLKAIVYRLYPSKSQQRGLDQTLETCRRWYNRCLAERKDAYEQEQRTIGKYEQLRQVKTYKATNPYAGPVHSHVLHTVVQDLDKAFQAFFRRVKAGEAPGYPRFKGKHRFKSFGFKEYGNGFKVDGRRLKIAGIGRVAVRWHREVPGTIKTLRLTRKAGKWYAVLACAVAADPLPATGVDVCIDLGLTSLITTSEGAHVEHPAWYRRAQKRLRVAQRRVARRQKGGANRRQAVVALQREHERIANQRRDFLFKLSHRLLTTYDHVAIEDLRIRNMVKNHHLSKSILDAGWGLFATHLTSKAANAGRDVVFVNPAYTSRTCYACGQLVLHLPLSQRVFRCMCGYVADRDENAARNILRLGQSRWASTSMVVGVAQEAAAL